MTERESATEKYLTDTVAVLGGLCLKFTVPGRRGYPDRLCSVVPGVSFFVETKRPKGGVLAELQKIRRRELELCGFRVYVAKNRGEIDALIEQERCRTSGRRS